MHQARLLSVFFMTLALVGCLATTSASGNKNIDQLPMYGGLDRQSVPELKAADEEFISGTTKEFGSREKASDTFVEQGIRYYQQNNYPAAMRRFNQAWLLNSKNPNAFWGFAVVYHDQERICEAKDMIDRALGLNLSKPIALADAGRIYTLCAVFREKPFDPATKSALFSKSEELFKRADAASPNNDYVSGLWASAYYWQGNYAKAWEKVEKMRSAGGTPPGAFINMLREKMPEPKKK
jgi:tetratricopeptide (TPR) repeat protein